LANPQFDLKAGIGLQATVTVSFLGIEDLLFTIDGDTIQIRARDTLSIIASFGSTGAGDDNFSAPTNLCVDKACVYVLDSGNSRIKKHMGTTGAYYAQSALSWMTAAPNIPIAVDRRRLLFGKATASTYVYDRHKNHFAEEHAYFDCGAGGVVGLAVIQDYFFVATTTRLEKRLLSDGTLIATWNTVPAGFAVASIATDGTFVYVLCTKAATDCKIIKVYVSDLFEHSSDDITGKQTPTGLACDVSYLYFPNTADTTINRVDNDMDPASLVSIADCAAPQGIACLANYFDTLPAESVGDLTAAGTAAPSGAMTIGTSLSLAASGSAAPTGTAVISKPGYVAAAGTAAPAGTAVIARVGTLVAAGTGAPSGVAVIAKVGSIAAAGSAAPSGAAVVEAGEVAAGAVAAAAATVGMTATTTAATVRY